MEDFDMMSDELELPYLTDDEAEARVEETGKSLDYIDAKTGQSCHIEAQDSDVPDGQEHPGTGELGGEEAPPMESNVVKAWEGDDSLLHHGTKDSSLSLGDLKPSTPGMSGIYGGGVYMTHDPELAHTYAGSRGNVLSATHDFKKPLHIDALEGINYRYSPKHRDRIEAGIYDTIVPGLRVPPFDAKIGGKWHPFRDRHDLMRLGAIAKTHGHDVVHIHGVDDSDSHPETLVLDPSRLTPHKLS